MDDLDSAMSQALLGSPQPAPPASVGTTKGVRTNNPGNLMPKGQQAQFQSPEDGLKAMDGNLQAYGKQGINTLSGITHKWAPASVAGNDPDAYAADIAKRLGIGVNDPIDLSNAMVRHAVGTGIMLHENGVKGIFGNKVASAANAPEVDPMDAQMQSALLGTGQPAKTTAPAAKAPNVTAPYGTSVTQMAGAAANTLQKINDAAAGIPGAVGDTIMHYGSGALAAVPAGVAGVGAGAWARIKALAESKTEAQGKQAAVDAASDTINAVQNALTWEPKTAGGKTAQTVMQHPANPINYPAEAGDYLGGKAAEVGLPGLGAALNIAGQAGSAYLGGKVIGGVSKAASAVGDRITKAPPPAALPPTSATTPAAKPRIRVQAGQSIPEQNLPATTTASTAPEAASIDGKSLQSEPVAGGVNKGAIAERADVLRRIGLDKVRTSALTGDALNAGTDWETGKFNEPAGQAAKAQFGAERAALENQAKGIINDTGGTMGLDEDTVTGRGRTIAAPFDALRDYFSKAKDALYKQAEDRAAGMPNVSTDTVDSLFQDRTFKNTARAAGQQHLLDSIADQLQGFKEDNPGGLTVQNAEQYRQWLNSIWKPDNSALLGQVKEALDHDVLGAAGEDVYSQARELHKLEKQTLDNPKGVARLMDHDPQTPVNRVTPYSKVADTVTRLDPDQFGNVIDTLQKMPPEIQPLAQRAIAEIKGHMANRINEVGSKEQGQWNNQGVNQYLANNSGKIKKVFTTPAEVQKLSDLQQAGNILRAPAGYPGAAAQAANAVKRGLMSNMIVPVSTAAGGALGSVVGAPNIGAAIGGAVGLKGAIAAGEKAAVKKFQKGVTDLKPQTVPIRSMLKP